ncbi:hypothetical protein [Bacteroides thetaiotaomicron]|jgi:hypothetical protein|uniref:Transmembrane protein n=1 Tax=Bacteroides thetaiotaomicron TaxID=818 RepID=A0A174UW00_BACT4|nr:hypothetical protein [Bacteroides thetaiotaomicron]CUQ23905.1 Uncharacterised protein [Bacteroides thetaiotaomicron]
MNRAIKIIAYLAVASLLSYLANNGDREFIQGFSSNIISLLTTILAINIPTSTLIISEINRIKEKTDIQPIATFKELKHGLIMQIAVLICLFVIQTVCGFLKNKNIIGESVVNIISDSFVIAAFIYYLEVIYDLGIALFDLITFKVKDE